MKTTRITFIGGGNMAYALMEGLHDSGEFEIRVADPTEAAREQAQELQGVTAFEDNLVALEKADCVVFAVKPQIMPAVCTQIAGAIAEYQPLLISVAAGIKCRQMSAWFGGFERIVRAMPNTPALIGAGATGLFAADGVTGEDRQLSSAVFESVGLAVWVERETLIDAVTALSGSGPAYFFFLLEALESTAIDMGLATADARRLARQTALGAALMALREDDELGGLRQRVTSPGGTTEAAIKTFSEHGLPSIVESALQAAAERARELAAEFGNR